jgi:hypothetical protein
VAYNRRRSWSESLCKRICMSVSLYDDIHIEIQNFAKRLRSTFLV